MFFLSQAALAMLICGTAFAQMMQVPFVASGAKAPPLVLLTMARDEKLIAPAYNDYSDIDGDGLTDVGYKTDPNFKYFGNFSADLCYSYSGSTELFTPTTPATSKKCSGAWSGDFLNYVTTSRLDALRRSLYGGYRVVDTIDSTVLERAFVPQDAHVWGKEYDPSIHAYSISDYTPLSAPATGRRHLFANVTLLGTTKPLLRVLTSRTERIWNWVLKETPVGSDNSLDNRNGDAIADNYVLRTVVCPRANPTLRDADCKEYPGAGGVPNYKPTGVLHDYGESKAVAFGLLSGSYENPRSGGVLRRNMGYFDSEIIPATGIFRTDVLGIVRTIDRFRIAEFSRGGTYYGYDCNPSTQGDCGDFTNPVAEMMYEGLRYLAGGRNPVPGFASGALDSELGLSSEAWLNPFRPANDGGFPYCSKPVQMVVSDIKPTFDSDELPGSSFSNGFSPPTEPSSLSALNVTTVANSIWSLEGLPTGRYFIGESQANTPAYDQSPSLKTVNSFGNIRGLAPEVPTRQGSYYSASIAKFGKDTNVADSTAPSGVRRNVDTYAIALSTPLPSLNIPVAGATVKLIPVGQSLVGCSFGGFRAGSNYPANRIVGFYIERIVNIPGFPTDSTSATGNSGRPFARFRVGFEDNEEGTDNDMDAIVIYELAVTLDNKVIVRMDAEYAAGCIGQHLGFVIAGTTEDGKYLGVRDPDTPCGDDRLFPLLGDDVANSSENPNLASSPWAANRFVCRDTNGVPTGLGTRYARTFTPSGNNVGGNIPNDPLWYAVKHGGPKAPKVDGVNPEGYFLVTNPALLRSQIGQALSTIVANLNSGSTALRFSGSIARTNSRVYVPRYETGNWSGAIEALRVDPATGSIGSKIWSTTEDASLTPNSATSTTWQSRNVYTRIGGTVRLLQANNTTDPIFSDVLLSSRLASPAVTALFATSVPALTNNQILKRVVDFVRGDPSNERKYGGRLRSRGGVPTATDPTGGGFLNTTVGSIVNSSITTQSATDEGYASFKTTMGTQATSYSAYVNAKSSKPAMVYFGSNEGMLHAIGDADGLEKWAFIPAAVQEHISKLADPGYAHRYTVDAPITVADYFDGSWKTVLLGSTGAGAKSVFAIDVTNPLSPDVLWELSGADIPELGHVLRGLRVARDSGGKWVAVFGNGYKSSAATLPGAALVVVELTKPLSGLPPMKVIPVDPAATVENGLAVPALVSIGGNASKAWAGDLNGTLWRFDLAGAYTSWKLAASKVLFNAAAGGVRQPITAEPAVIPSLAGGYTLYFGTGKFYEVNDPASKAVQSFYSVYDAGAGVVAKRDLTQFNVTTSAASRTMQQSGAAGFNGFFVDLVSGGTAKGERVVASPLVLFGYALFNTVELNSTDPCLPGLSGWRMAADAIVGGNPAVAVFGVTPSTPGNNAVNIAGTASDGSLTGVSVISTLSGDLVLNFGSVSGSSAGSGAGGPTCKQNPKQAKCNKIQQSKQTWRRVL